MEEKSAGNKAQLGCGTLIIIAIIVAFFSGGRDSKNLRSQLDEMNRKLDRLEQRVGVIAEKLNAQPAQAPPAR